MVHVRHADARVEVAGIGAQDVAPEALRILQAALPPAQARPAGVRLDRLDPAVLHVLEDGLRLGVAAGPGQAIPQTEEDAGVVGADWAKRPEQIDRFAVVVPPGQHPGELEPQVEIIRSQGQGAAVAGGRFFERVVPRLQKGEPVQGVEIVRLQPDRLPVENHGRLEVLARERGVGLLEDVGQRTPGRPSPLDRRARGFLRRDGRRLRPGGEPGGARTGEREDDQGGPAGAAHGV